MSTPIQTLYLYDYSTAVQVKKLIAQSADLTNLGEDFTFKSYTPLVANTNAPAIETSGTQLFVNATFKTVYSYQGSDEVLGQDSTFKSYTALPANNISTVIETSGTQPFVNTTFKTVFSYSGPLRSSTTSEVTTGGGVTTTQVWKTG